MKLWKDPPAETVRLRWIELPGLIAVLGVFVYINRGALKGFFVHDDFPWLIYSRFESFHEYLQCFFRFNAVWAYRPLSQETFFWLGQKLFGLWAPGFHLVSVTTHLLASSLVYLLLRRFCSPVPSLAGTAVFALHGAHLLSVYWVSALPEPLALVFFLSALLGFIRFDQNNDRRAYVFSILAMVFGMMSKESILSLPLVLLTYCLVLSRRKLVWTAPYFALSGIYASLRALSNTVKGAPYPLSFGMETWRNFLVYLSWTGGFSESLIKRWLYWTAESRYLLISVGFGIAVAALVVFSRNRRIALFSLLWFPIALQPILYFSGHNFAYYLAPALPALSLLIASSFPDRWDLQVCMRGLLSMALTGFLLCSSVLTLRIEGNWLLERSLARQDFLQKMIKVDRRVPEGSLAYVFGLHQDEFDLFENGVAFRAFGISTEKFYFVLPVPDQDLRALPGKLRETQSLDISYCFVLESGDIRERTQEFRTNPEPFFNLQTAEYEERPEVRLEVSQGVLTRGRDTLVLRATNFPVPAIDLLYSIDGRLMPAVIHWGLDKSQSTTVFVDKSTPPGLYHFKAIRDSREGNPWIKVDALVEVR